MCNHIHITLVQLHTLTELVCLMLTKKCIQANVMTLMSKHICQHSRYMKKLHKLYCSKVNIFVMNNSCPLKFSENFREDNIFEEIQLLCLVFTETGSYIYIYIYVCYFKFEFLKIKFLCKYLTQFYLNFFPL